MYSPHESRASQLAFKSYYQLAIWSWVAERTVEEYFFEQDIARELDLGRGIIPPILKNLEEMRQIECRSPDASPLRKVLPYYRLETKSWETVRPYLASLVELDSTLRQR